MCHGTVTLPTPVVCHKSATLSTLVQWRGDAHPRHMSTRGEVMLILVICQHIHDIVCFRLVALVNIMFVRDGEVMLILVICLWLKLRYSDTCNLQLRTAICNANAQCERQTTLTNTLRSHNQYQQRHRRFKNDHAHVLNTIRESTHTL